MRPEPYRAYNFALLIEGSVSGGFVSLSGLGAEVEVIRYREGGGGQAVRHLPGLVTHAPVELRYGITQDPALWTWFRSAEAGTLLRRNISVVQYANDGLTEAHRWNLYDAWPSAFRVGAMNALANEIAIESLTLVYDRLERD